MKISDRQKNLAKDLVKYIPPVVIVDGLAMALVMMRLDAESNSYIEKAHKSLEKSFISYQREIRSNNWFKMHGMPMRRKRRRR